MTGAGCVGGKKNKKGDLSPAQRVKKLMKAGKVKKKCCRSDDRCKRCPVLALKRAKSEYGKAA